MKFEIMANELADVLARVRAVVPGGMTMPILSTYLLEAQPGELAAMASNIDVQARATTRCDVDAPGRICISATAFGVIKALGKTAIAVELTDDESPRAIVTGKRQRYEFATLPADMFPVMVPTELGEGLTSFELPASKLKAALAATLEAVSDNFTQPHICGVCVCRDGNDLAFVATDKHRLVRYLAPMPDGAGAIASHIIPAKTARLILSSLDKSEEAVRVSLSAPTITIEAGCFSLVSKLIAGSFLDYQGAVAKLPKDEGVRVFRTEIVEAVQRIVALHPETKEPVVHLQNNDAGGVDLTSDRRGMNGGVESIDAEVVAPTSFYVATRYLSPLIGMWPEAAELRISAPVPGGPITIKSPSVPGLFQLVMPITP